MNSAGSRGSARQSDLFWENTDIPHSRLSVRCFGISDSKQFLIATLRSAGLHLLLRAFRGSSCPLHSLSCCLNPPRKPSRPNLVDSSQPITPFWVFLDFFPATLLSRFPWCYSLSHSKAFPNLTHKCCNNGRMLHIKSSPAAPWSKEALVHRMLWSTPFHT